MGEDGRGGGADDATIEKEIDVERARGVPGASSPARGPLEASEPSEKLFGREARPADEDGVDE